MMTPLKELKNRRDPVETDGWAMSRDDRGIVIAEGSDRCNPRIPFIGLPVSTLTWLVLDY